MALTTVEERLSRLEGVYDHLASKADVAGVKTQIADLRTELKGDIAGVRTELKADIEGLRGELKGDIAGLRAELKGDIAGLRTELKGDISGLRTELKGDISGLRTEIYRVNASSIKWILSFMAGCMVVGLGAMTAIVGFLG